jgi:hypothetical protein
MAILQAEQLQRSASIAAFLHDEIKHLAFIIDGAPQIRTLAVSARSRS